ncbi:hypothetical protein NHQ30_005002 [Ciborinia camelliae]|nr:hypothetical protein NHQ30_005002 [Ciborinia camelliae]
MTSNKHKKSTPRKSPQKFSPHKHQKSHKSHKSPKEKVAASKPQSPIHPQKYARDLHPILPTQRWLFPQSAKQNNELEPFSSPLAKKDHQMSKKHSLSSPVTKYSDDRPPKKQCLTSPSHAKSSKVLPIEKNKANKQTRMSTLSDDEDEDDTPSPPSRKRKTNANGCATGSHKKIPLSVAAPPPNVGVSVVTPPKQHPFTSFSTIQPNSPAVTKVDIAVLRLEKEELQQRLDTSVQQAKYDAKTWGAKFKANAADMAKVQRRLDTEIQRHREVATTAKTLIVECDILKETNARHERAILACKAECKEQKEANQRSQEQHRQQQLVLEKKIKLSQSEQLNLETKVALLKQELRHWERCEIDQTETQSGVRDRVTLLAKQVAQLSETKEELTNQVAQLKEELQHKEQLDFQITQLQEDLQFKDELASQALRTHAFEKDALTQQITHLQSQLQSQTSLTEQVNRLNQEIHHCREELLDKQEEIDILTDDNAKATSSLHVEIRKLQNFNKQKDMGLQKMGTLVASWAMKWHAAGYGNTEGKIPGVEGMGVSVNGARMD